MIVLAVLLSLGCHAVVETLQEVTVSYGPWPIWLDRLIRLLTACALALVSDDLGTYIVVVAGVWGLSLLVKEIHEAMFWNTARTKADLASGRSRRYLPGA